MIIGFWSEQAGRGYSTYNMLATAISLSSKIRNNVALMQGKRDYNRIEYAFVPYEENDILKEDYGYYNYKGMDTVINKMEAGILDEANYMNELIRIQKSNLYYLRSGISVDTDGVYGRFSKIFDNYMRFLKVSNIVNFIELSSGFEEINEERLKVFDALVVNISQDGKGLKKILANEWIKDNAFFVVGCYDSDSEYNLNNLQRKYSLNNERLGMLPYSIKFRDAVCSGRCVEFYDRHKEDKREDGEYELIKCMNNISDMLIKGCGIH